MSEALLARTLEHLRHLIAFDTRNPPRAIGTGGIFDYLRAQLPGFTVTVTDHGAGAVSMLAVRGNPKRVFNVHLDTVPSSPNWSADPHVLRIEGGAGIDTVSFASATSGVVLTLLAGLFLKEKPGPRRYAAVGVGMVGILLILRPNFAEFGLVVLYPLAAAFAYAINMLVTKRATREASGLAFQFGASIFGAVALLAAMVLQLGWDGVSVVSTQIPPWAIAAVIASGILSAVTFLLIALAFTLAQASLLAPFQYLEILGATILGYLVFGDMPDLLTIIGTLIVLGSGLYVFHREGKARVPSRKIRARSDR